MKRRKFADGGETTEMRPSAKPEGGRFDGDTYSRARRFVESGGKKEETKTATKKARKVEVDPTAGEAKDKAAQRAADMMDSAPAKQSTGRAEIPVDPNGPRAPASTGKSTSGPSNIQRILTGTGAGGAALGAAAAMRTAGHADRTAKRVAKAIQSAKVGDKARAPTVQATKSTERFTPKQQLEAAESTMRGATTREALRRKRAEEAMGMDYKKGGSVKKYAEGGSVGSASRRADGIATKGKTKCRIV